MAVKALILLLLAATLYSQENIAVLDLDADGVTASEAKTLTNKLRGELINTGRFVVIERGQMDEILKEQGFQKTGCTSQECVVEVGQLLGVKSMIAGSIGKVGSIFLISLRLLDVAKGNVLKNADEEIEGDISEVLRRGVRNAARKIAGLEPDQPVTPKKALPPPPSTLVYKTKSRPPGLALAPPAENPAVAEQQNQRAAYARRRQPHSFSFAYGRCLLDLKSFHWQQAGSFDAKYQGLKWNSGHHLEFDVAPILLYGDSTKSSVLFRNELGADFDRITSAPSEVTLEFNGLPGAMTQQFEDGDFRMSRFGIFDKLVLGYAVRFPSIALEPYLGINAKFDFDGISGKAVGNKTLMTQYLRFGFPLGIRFCFSAVFVGFEYSTFFKSIQIDDNLDYDATTNESITGGFSDEGDAFWAIHLGRIF